MPVICTGGFQTASVITQGAGAAATATRSASRGRSSPTTIWSRCSRRGQDRADKPCTYCNRCLVNVVENPLGCYEETRFPSRDAMIAQIMSVFDPPPFAADAAGVGVCHGPRRGNHRAGRGGGHRAVHRVPQGGDGEAAPDRRRGGASTRHATTACVDAEFTVLDDLPAEHRVGLFAAPRTYQALDPVRQRLVAIRSRARHPRHVDPGARRRRREPDARRRPCQDFVLNSHPGDDGAGHAGVPRAAAGQRGRRLPPGALFPHAPEGGAHRAWPSRANPTCHLDIPYWSTTPYRFGAGRAVKYIGRARRRPRGARCRRTLTDTYLRDAMRTRLDESRGDLRLPGAVPGRRARGRRSRTRRSSGRTKDSPYLPVARIRIPRQAIRRRRPRDAGASRWPSTRGTACAEHRPLGSMNRARREIYQAMAQLRGTAPQRV